MRQNVGADQVAVGGEASAPADSAALPVVDWTGWRGPKRDGRVPWLPASLPEKLQVAWRKPLSVRGLGGVAATRSVVIVSDRDLKNTADVFRCFDAATGNALWTVVSPADGHLDFGNSSRATPLIDGDRVFLAGAFGGVQCVRLKDGEPIWELDLSVEFEPPPELPWGYCASPLLVDGKLIVAPGTSNASLVALEAATGKILWQSPGIAPGYGSFIAETFGGKLQIVGHDKTSLGGWDPATGNRLWRIVPPNPNDFNVPTPIAADGKLVICTENNGTRVFSFRDDGTIIPKPVAGNEELASDTHTPVAVGKRLFGVAGEMYCLDLDNGLKPIWHSDDDAFAVHASVIASNDRVLVLTVDGELLLIDGKSDDFRLLGSADVFDDDHGDYSHPALVGNRLYVRGTSEVVCIELPK